MQFANVVLLNRTDSVFIVGAVTKDDGTFTIETDKQDGILKVTSVGYTIKYIDARQGNVGDIQMQPDTQMLGEVVVKGHVPQFQMGNEGLITNVENTLLSQLGTAGDVLKHVPGIIATMPRSLCLSFNRKHIAPSTTSITCNGRCFFELTSATSPSPINMPAF